MLKLTRLAFIGLFLAGFAVAEIKKAGADELEKILKDEKNVFLLDVREPHELVESGSVKGYVNIPLGQLESRLKEVPKDKVIVTLCRRGVRASTAGDLLVKNGYKVLAACGMEDWRAKNKPVVYPKK